MAASSWKAALAASGHYRSERPLPALCVEMCVAQHLSLLAHNSKRLTSSHRQLAHALKRNLGGPHKYEMPSNMLLQFEE
jgi:hypothetical protein